MICIIVCNYSNDTGAIWGPMHFQIQNTEPSLALLGHLPANLDLDLHSHSGKDTTADEEKGGGVNLCTSPLGFSISFQALSLELQVCASTTRQRVYTVAELWQFYLFSSVRVEGQRQQLYGSAVSSENCGCRLLS